MPARTRGSGACQGDADPGILVSNTFTMEWPPNAGRQREFPEVDRCDWFGVAEVRRRANHAQAAFLDRLEAALAVQQQPLGDCQGDCQEGGAVVISKVMHVTLVVGNQEEGMNWYTEKLGFRKRADFPMESNGRWITVAPQDGMDLEIVLQPPDCLNGEERNARPLRSVKTPPWCRAWTTAEPPAPN